MQDVLIKQNNEGLYDIDIDGADFKSANGFESAIVVSLFTDARAPSSLVQDPKKRRGAIINILTISVNRELGSLLWIYEQSRITATIINQVKNTVLNSLRWMIEDGVVRSIDVNVSIKDVRSLNIDIAFISDNNQIEQYSIIWRSTDARNFILE